MVPFFICTPNLPNAKREKLNTWSLRCMGNIHNHKNNKYIIYMEHTYCLMEWQHWHYGFTSKLSHICLLSCYISLELIQGHQSNLLIDCTKRRETDWTHPGWTPLCHWKEGSFGGMHQLQEQAEPAPAHPT
jgi:hypothetical protein